MKAKERKNLFQIILMMLAMLMIIATPFMASAEETNGKIKVYMTITNKGAFALTKDAEPMAMKEVTVTDLDSNGLYTFDEALEAAHEAYNSKDGYVFSVSGVERLWGVEETINLFYINGNIISEGVTSDLVKEGDYLIASILADQVYYGDWISQFEKTKVKVTTGNTVTLNVSGHLGIAAEEKDAIYRPLKGINVGVWNNGSLEKVLGATDGKGNVSLTFDKPGTYVIGAKGTVEAAVTDWDLLSQDVVGDMGLPEGTYIRFDESYESDFAVGYTKEDYGNGPYPLDKIIWIDWMDWYQESGFSGHLLTSNKIITNCPIIPPACIITVNEGNPITKATITVPAKTYTGKALTPEVTVKYGEKTLVKDKDYIVTYSNNKNVGKEAKATITGKGDYTGTVTKTFTINKAKQPMKVTVKNKTFKVKDLKKSKKVYKAVNVTKNQGKVTYKIKYVKNAKKFLTFSNGKVTVKKKAKKGTYEIKVTITAKGTANYLKGSITKSIKVKVK